VAPPAEGELPAEDIWRRARIVERYEDFLRCSVDWLWETDSALKLIYVSAPVALKLGIPARVLIGRSLLGLGHFAPAGDAMAAIEARRPFRGAGFIMTGAGQRKVTYRLSGVPYFEEESGRFAGYRGTALLAPPADEQADARDQEIGALTATLEDALLRAHDLSWRLSAAGRAAPAQPPAPAPIPPQPQPQPPATVPLERTAHELRTPLNAIIGYAELGLNELFGPLGERYLDCFRTIREAGRHLDGLVTQMREAATRQGQPALARESVDVAAVVAKAKAMIALSARAADVDVCRIGPLAGGNVVGDEQACTQILVNLLSNAVKFTPAGGSVGLETLVGPDNKLQIVVWDTGTGIPLEEQQAIFQADYRAKDVRAQNKVPGFGLGLAISRDLARAMGGDLTVVSQPDQGSRFILSLPLAEAPTQTGT